MIKINSFLRSTDNSGAYIVKCLQIYRKEKKTGRFGDIVLISITTYNSRKKLKKGELHKAIIVRTKFKTNDGVSHVKFSDNAVVLLTKKLWPLGSRLFGLTLRSLRLYNKKTFLMLPYST